MALFQFDSGRSNPFRDIVAGRQSPLDPSSHLRNSALSDRREWPSLQISLPEFEQDFPAYPPEAVEVRNTFIHVASPSAEADDRPVLSCPASKIGWIEHGQIEQGRPSSPSPASLSPVQKQDDSSLSSLLSRPVIHLGNALDVQDAADTKNRRFQVPFSGPVGRSQGPRAVGVIGDQRGRQSTFTLQAAYSGEALQVGLGSPGAPGPAPAGLLCPGRAVPMPNEKPKNELPSVGSAGHAFGTCKPCGFFYAKGCLNGATCSFCHLCDRGEKKRRQKQKKAQRGGA